MQKMENEDLLTELSTHFPSLIVTIKGRSLLLRGNLPLAIEDNTVTQYLISAEFPEIEDGFVIRDPIIMELGGRIPRDIDWHIYKNGTCCLYPPEYFEINYIHGNPIRVIDFINKPLRSYFVSQYVFEQKKEWPFGAYSHGPKGILEYYQDITGVQGIHNIRRLLQLVGHEGHIDGSLKCYCGSRKINQCHQHFLHVLNLRKKIPHHVARNSYGKLSDFVEATAI
jgi:hypothetical protein